MKDEQTKKIAKRIVKSFLKMTLIDGVKFSVNGTSVEEMDDKGEEIIAKMRPLVKELFGKELKSMSVELK